MYVILKQLVTAYTTFIWRKLVLPTCITICGVPLALRLRLHHLKTGTKTAFAIAWQVWRISYDQHHHIILFISFSIRAMRYTYAGVLANIIRNAWLNVVSMCHCSMPVAFCTPTQKSRVRFVVPLCWLRNSNVSMCNVSHLCWSSKYTVSKTKRQRPYRLNSFLNSTSRSLSPSVAIKDVYHKDRKLTFKPIR